MNNVISIISITNDCRLYFGTTLPPPMNCCLSVGRNYSSRIIAWTIFFAKCTLNTVDYYVCLVYNFPFSFTV